MPKQSDKSPTLKAPPKSNDAGVNNPTHRWDESDLEKIQSQMETDRQNGSLNETMDDGEGEGVDSKPDFHISKGGEGRDRKLN